MNLCWHWLPQIHLKSRRRYTKINFSILFEEWLVKNYPVLHRTLSNNFSYLKTKLHLEKFKYLPTCFSVDICAQDYKCEMCFASKVTSKGRKARRDPTIVQERVSWHGFTIHTVRFLKFWKWTSSLSKLHTHFWMRKKWYEAENYFQNRIHGGKFMSRKNYYSYYAEDEKGLNEMIKISM